MRSAFSHSTRGRWALTAALAALTLALASCSTAAQTSADRDTGAPVSQGVSDEARAAARLAPCPQPAAAPVGDGPLAGITLDCLADGRAVKLTDALAGTPALINLWAYWCGPCAEELPLLQQFSDRAAGAVTVLTVHSDPSAAKGLSRLTGLDNHLPGVSDPDTKVRNAVGAPAVLPISILVRPDGTVAKLVVRPFKSLADISDTVAEELGVKV